MSPQRLVIIGGGMAGTRLAEEVLARDPEQRWHVTLVGDEPDPPYNRILLSEVLAGSHRPDDIGLLPEGVFEGSAVTHIVGTRVTMIHRSSQTVHLADQRVLRYDHLVLATGSLPLLPPLQGLREPEGALHPACYAFRTLRDCRDIVAACHSARRAVVVGGGLLGLEAARGLLERGLEVEVLHMAPWLMNTQLDPEAGEVLARTLLKLGVQPYLEARAKAIESDADGRLLGVRVADGHLLECDLVVFAAGVRPSTRLAREARLAVGRGVVVDKRMCTSDPSISAIGDCAEVHGAVPGLVGPAWDQAGVLAEVLTDPTANVAYAPSRVVTRLKASGIELAAMGETGPMPADSDASTEVVAYSDYAHGVYKKIVVRDGRLAGAILLGDVATAGDLTLALDRGTPVTGDRLRLLFAGLEEAGSDSLEQSADATLCHCNNVTYATVRDAVVGGAQSVAEVAACTRATTGCGTCRGSVADVLRAHAASSEPPVEASPVEASPVEASTGISATQPGHEERRTA